MGPLSPDALDQVSSILSIQIVYVYYDPGLNETCLEFICRRSDFREVESQVWDGLRGRGYTVLAGSADIPHDVKALTITSVAYSVLSAMAIGLVGITLLRRRP